MTRMQELGFQICLVTMRLSIPSEKLCKIQQDAWRMIHQASALVREIARFVGKTAATMKTIPLVSLHYQALRMQTNSVLPLNYNQEEMLDRYNVILSPNTASREDLEWWIALPPTPVETPVYPPDPSLTMCSDASNQGWGAVLNGKTKTGCVWNVYESTHHINYLELLAAFLEIKAFGKTWQNL